MPHVIIVLPTPSPVIPSLPVQSRFITRPQLLTRLSSPSLREGLSIVPPVGLSNRAAARK